MNKKALDEKYFYQIDEHNVVHLFRGEDEIMTFCIVNKFDMPKLKELVHEIDPTAFIVTEDVHEVEGGRFRKRKCRIEIKT